MALLAPGVSAETMQCFNGAVDAAEVERPTRAEVERRCGQPDEQDGEVWVYQHSQFIYRLRFDHDDKLYLIQRQHRQQ